MFTYFYSIITIALFNTNVILIITKEILFNGRVKDLKNRSITIILFILFALPVPAAILGSLISLLWLFRSIMAAAPFLEVVVSLVGVVIAATYIVTYIFSLNQTWKNSRLSFETFFPAVHCLIACLFLLSLNPVGRYISDTYEYFGFAKKDFSVIEELDTHGGFHGDGFYYLILDCSENKQVALENVSRWEPLPLSENLALIMYGGHKDGMWHGYNLAEEANIPAIENGYYIFKDRHSDSGGSADDSELFNRQSFNFSLAIYDSDADIMYYFEFDT